MCLTFDGQRCAAAGVSHTVVGFTDIVSTVLSTGLIDGEQRHGINEGHAVFPTFVKLTVISEPQNFDFWGTTYFTFQLDGFSLLCNF